MLTEKISRQEFAVRVLAAHVRNSRISHTYLFTGEKESGKEELAVAFAQALNCLEKNDFKACACNSCRKIEKRIHPDVRVLGEDEEARSIKIEEIRDSISAASLKPYEGRWKVFILTGAERLTIDASNALLKTLEEAPAHTVFILITATKANMLETIQSRAFEIRLKPLGGEEPLPESFAPDRAGVAWEDFFEQAASSRGELGEVLDQLLRYFRKRLAETSGPAQEAYLEAIDLLTESKDALDGNANQKLVASRLAMQLRKKLQIASLRSQ